MDEKKKTVSEAALIARSQNGDAAAIEELMERYKDMVAVKARKLYLIGAQREDLIQEGMIGLYKAICGYDPKGQASFSHYAEICVQRKMYSAIEAAARQKNIPLNFYVSIYGSEGGENAADDEAPPLVDILKNEGEQNPEEIMIDRENVDRINELIEKRLSPLEKKVLDLYIAGLDYPKMAEVLGKQPKSIDNALQRIRKKLSKH